MAGLRLIALVFLAASLCITPARAANTEVPSQSWTQYQYDAEGNAVFDAPNWSVSWRADIGKRSNGGISLVGSTAYIDSFDHCVYAFDAQTGQKRWRQKLPDVLMNTPLVVSGVVIVGTGTADILEDSSTLWVMGKPTGDAIYGLDAKTGRVLWRFNTVGENMPTGVIVTVKNRSQFVYEWR